MTPRSTLDACSRGNVQLCATTAPQTSLPHTQRTTRLGTVSQSFPIPAPEEFVSKARLRVPREVLDEELREGLFKRLIRSAHWWPVLRQPGTEDGPKAIEQTIHHKKDNMEEQQQSDGEMPKMIQPQLTHNERPTMTEPSNLSKQANQGEQPRIVNRPSIYEHPDMVQHSSDENKPELEEREESTDKMWWRAAMQCEIFAEPGRVLQEFNDQSKLTPISLKPETRDRVQPTFIRTQIGLPQFLVNHFSKSQPRQEIHYKISLAPSPFAWPELRKQQARPGLEITLAVDNETRSVSFKRFAAILGQPAVDVQLPNLATDVRFTIKRFVLCENAQHDPNVAAFIKEIQNSTHGYGGLRPPLNLQLQIPRTLIRKQETIGASTFLKPYDTVNVPYIVTSVEHEESLISTLR